MELLEVIVNALQLTAMQLLIVWPFAVLASGVFLFAKSKKRYAIEAVGLSIILGVIVGLIFAMGQAYGFGVRPYQYAAVAFYYILLLGWVSRLLYIKKKHA